MYSIRKHTYLIIMYIQHTHAHTYTHIYTSTQHASARVPKVQYAMHALNVSPVTAIVASPNRYHQWA